MPFKRLLSISLCLSLFALLILPLQGCCDVGWRRHHFHEYGEGEHERLDVDSEYHY